MYYKIFSYKTFASKEAKVDTRGPLGHWEGQGLSWVVNLTVVDGGVASILSLVNFPNLSRPILDVFET